MPKADVTLPAAASSVPTARHFVESVLTAWDLRDLGWNAALIVSELAANAALHAGGGSFTIGIDSDRGDGVRLEVRDRSRRMPRQRAHSTDATTGRGLRLVETLAADWGVEPQPDGKTVWVVLDRRDGAGAVDDDLRLDAILRAFDEVDVPAEPGGPVAHWVGLAA